MADSPSHDQELLRQLARGNEAAFRALYERYQGPIYRFALHMSGNSATAEEVTQEVFMSLIGNTKGYQPEKGAVAGYLFGMARNLTRRSIQRRHLDVPIGDYDGNGHTLDVAADMDVLQEVTQADLLDSLHRAVLSLPEPYREAIVLCDLEEMNYASAAELLGCAPGTVASRLHRGHAILKTKLSCQKCAK